MRFSPAKTMLLAGLCLAVAACAGAEMPTRTPAQDTLRREFVAHASVSILPKQGEPLPQAVEQILLSPREATVSPGQRIILTAMALDVSGKPVAHGPLRWSVTPPEAGAIDDNGLFVSGQELGTFDRAISVEIESGGRTVRAHSSVEVVDPDQTAAGSLETLVVYPPAVRTRPGQVIGLGAVGWDSRSRFVPNLRFEWKVQDRAAGRVDSLGFFTASMEPGSYPDAIELTATQTSSAGPIQQRATVSVVITETLRSGVLDQVVVVPRQVQVRPGQPLSFIARGFDQTGQRLDGLAFEWEIGDPNAGQLPRPGSFVAGAKTGTYPQAIVVVGKQNTPQGVVRATATVTVTVFDDRASEATNVLTAAQVMPGGVTLRPGERFVFVGRGLGPRGNTVAARTAWTVDSPDAGVFEQQGLFRASRKPGTYRNAITLELTQERPGQPAIKIIAHASVNIVGPLDRVQVTPEGATVQSGQAVKFTARGFDAAGLEVTPLTARWRIEDPTAGTIDQTGLFIAGPNQGAFDNVITTTVFEPNTG